MLGILVVGGTPATAAGQRPLAGPALELRDAGPGEPGRLVRSVLARPHLVLTSTAERLDLPRDTTFASSVVVVGADVTVASRIEGDLLVLGGDLFLHPGAVIRGRAVAVGGGVYNSLLAVVEGGRHAFRDVTFDAVATGGTLALSYRTLLDDEPDRLVWPGLYGLRLPSYARVDGLALTVGPRITARRGGITVDPMLTYRSHLGALDPSLAVSFAASRRTTFDVVAERSTYSNEAWARHDLVNAATTLAFGDDERNYYRATRVAAAVRRRWEGEAFVMEPWVGAETEDASSVGPRPGETSAPWSPRGRRDTTRMLRPNPAVEPGRITSALAGAGATWDDGDMAGRGALRVELPVSAPDDRRFAQLTLDLSTGFTAVRDHQVELAGHFVTTLGDLAPPQRFSYLGGGSTIPTLSTLALGGDQLVFVEGVYLVPLRRPALPLLGPPTVGLRYVAGSAGAGELPAIVQNVGLRLVVGPARVDLLIDPATRERSIGFGVAGFR